MGNGAAGVGSGVLGVYPSVARSGFWIPHNADGKVECVS